MGKVVERCAGQGVVLKWLDAAGHAHSVDLPGGGLSVDRGG